MQPRSIDLNCDLGEQPAGLGPGADLALFDLVTSANIACGGHAGDESTMAQTVRAALARGVAIGAHPSYPDRPRFGRVALDMPPDDLETAMAAQIEALERIARTFGTRVRHVKPHGALYHAAMTQPAVAGAVARAARRVRTDLALVGLAGAPALDTWRALGLRVVPEAFADRCYEPDGSLRPRTRAGALLSNPAAAAEQALRIAKGQGVVSADGTVIPISTQTICVHSDTPDAVAILRAVRTALERAGIVIHAAIAP